MAGRVVIPLWSGLLFHLSKLSQDVGWQLSVNVGLGDIITKLGWVVAIVYHGWVLKRDWGSVSGNDRVASRSVVRWYGVWELTRVSGLGERLVRLGTTHDLLRMGL